MSVQVLDSDIPWFISAPRSGSNWIQGMMELYFERPRGPLLNFRNKKHEFPLRYRWYYPKDTVKSDLLWNHHHDQMGFHCNPSTSVHGDMYLMRHPADVVYSCCQRDGSESRLHYHLTQYTKLLKKWAVEGRAKTVIVYEDMVAEPEKEFKKIVDHFNAPWDPEKFQEVYAKVTKKALVDLGGHRKDIAYPEMLTDKYAQDRLNFRRKHGGKIRKAALSDESEKWVGRYYEG